MKRRDVLKMAGLGAAAWAWPGLRGACAAGNGEGGFCYFVMADPQLFWGSKEDWQRAVGCANRLKPDFVIVCGDLINHPGDEKEAKAYLEVAATLDETIPLYNVSGNHDYVPSEPKSLGWYQARFGSPWYAFGHKNSFFVVFDSTMVKSGPEDGPLYQWQMQWLEDTLQAAQDKGYDHITVYTHYPLALRRADEDDEYFNLPRSRRRTLLGMFHKYHVDAVFSGHFHHNTYVKDGELELITTSSSGIALEQMGQPKDPLGFRIVKMYPGRIEHQYHAYDTLPERIVL
ncbi:MAG: metallophosphoesterase [Sedimentisphaerales bacterium]|nr:metallophosphoesterase [Sedimentisphaerales bacterium]